MSIFIYTQQLQW